MNFKPAFIFRNQTEPGLNAQVFATQEEAMKSAASRFRRWTMPIDYTTVETTDPVNYRWDDELGDVMIERKEVTT